MKLELIDISFRYEENEILKNINLEASEGKLVSILGPSGAGKTTLLKIIAGLLQPTSGDILMDGRSILNKRAGDRNMAYIFQAPTLFPHLTVRENISFGPRIKKWDGKAIDKKTNFLAERFRIENLMERLPRELSGGQQQRAAIARGLAIEPALLLMDEPFSNLDPNLRADMGMLIAEIQKDLNQTILFVTHDRDESLSLSDDLVILLEGEVKQSDSPDTIYYKPANEVVAGFLGEYNIIEGRAKENVFYSFLGNYPSSGIREGRAELFLRPHEISILESGNDYCITEIKKAGRTNHYKLSDGEHEVLAEAFAQFEYRIGQRVGAKVNREKDFHYINGKK